MRDVIEAEFLESFVNAQYIKTLHDHAVFRTKLDFIIEKKMRKALEGKYFDEDFHQNVHINCMFHIH